MNKGTQAAPTELVELQQRFQKWRDCNKRGKRIPKPLWLAAAKVASEIGVNRTARFLRLDYYSLKKQIAALQGSSSNGKRPATEQTAFVELPAPLTLLRECTIELQDGRGSSMRMHFKGTEYPDIVGMGRSFWSPQ